MMHKSILLSNLVTQMHVAFLMSDRRVQTDVAESPLPDGELPPDKKPPISDPPIPPEMPTPPDSVDLRLANNRLLLTRKVFVELANRGFSSCAI